MNEKRCCQSEVAAIFLGLWCLFVGPVAEVRAEAGELAAEWALQPLTDPAPPEVRVRAQAPVRVPVSHRRCRSCPTRRRREP